MNKQDLIDKYEAQLDLFENHPELYVTSDLVTMVEVQKPLLKEIIQDLKQLPNKSEVSEQDIKDAAYSHGEEQVGNSFNKCQSDNSFYTGAKWMRDQPKEERTIADTDFQCVNCGYGFQKDDKVCKICHPPTTEIKPLKRSSRGNVLVDQSDKNDGINATEIEEKPKMRTDSDVFPD